MNDVLNAVILKSNCIPGINYVAINDEENSSAIWIHEIYYKNEKEYKVVGIWHTTNEPKKLPYYSKCVYDELLKQGMNELGCMFNALEIKDENDSSEIMKYLTSIRNKNVSYTELWETRIQMIKIGDE